MFWDETGGGPTRQPALVGAPGASVERVKALWPAILGLALGLEEITQQATRGEEDAEEGGRGITAVARETYIEALVAAGRSADGATTGGRDRARTQGFHDHVEA
ncbi:unnamed protein product [Ascophyllum nodosum]